MGLEVIILREHSGSDEFLLKDIDKVQQVFGLPPADVVDSIRRDGQSILAGLLFRSFAHDPDDALHDVVNIREIAPTIAVIINLDGLAFQQLVRESEIGHVGASRRTVDGEKAETRGRDIVKL